MIDLSQSIRELLVARGLRDIDPDLRANLSLAAYKALEMRVGNRLAGRMSDKQLDEFEAYYNAKDDQGAYGWLEDHFPDHRSIVRVELDELLTEVGRQLDRWRGLM